MKYTVIWVPDAEEVGESAFASPTRDVQYFAIVAPSAGPVPVS
jgi:hypothetical protein